MKNARIIKFLEVTPKNISLKKHAKLLKDNHQRLLRKRYSFLSPLPYLDRLIQSMLIISKDKPLLQNKLHALQNSQNILINNLEHVDNCLRILYENIEDVTLMVENDEENKNK